MAGFSLLISKVSCTRWPRGPGSRAVLLNPGPGPGLVNGALCNDCDLAAEDMEVIASGKASGGGRSAAAAVPMTRAASIRGLIWAQKVTQRDCAVTAATA
eukprot:365532-Chlamydomonas_euryale.AAC.11